MKVFHFRPYTLHLGRYELSRGSMMLPLPRIAMEILILLVERRGDLLTRREIAAHVWPGSDPEDVFQSINTAVNRIRSTLRDEASNPKYVQTVIGKGYRFMAAVEEMNCVEEVSPLVPVSEAVLAPMGAFHGDAASLRKHGSSSFPAIPLSNTIPATQLGPSALPSVPEATGETLVFSHLGLRWRWTGVLIFLAVAAGAFVLWQRFFAAPNERRGAFKLAQLTTNGADEPVTAGAISPDGRSLAYADRHAVLLRDLGGAVHSLRAPGLVDVTRIEWFPDGHHILVSASSSATRAPQLWTVAIDDEAPRLIRNNAALGVPSPDGSQIAYTSANDGGGTTFWVSDAFGGNETRVNTAAQGIEYPAMLWSADARKLLLEEVSPPRADAKTDAGHDRAGRKAEHRLVAMDIQTHTATAAVDGLDMQAACIWGKSGLLFAGNVNESKQTGLWRVDLDPETGAPLAAPIQLQLLDEASALSRSADGRAVAAVLKMPQPDVYVGTLAKPVPELTDIQRLTFDPMQDYPQAWTSDSKSILFESNNSVRGGTAFHIYRQAVDGPARPEPLVSDPMVQVLPQQSPDGKWILFASKPRWLSGEPYKLYRVPEAGGAPVQVDLGGPLDEYRCPLFGKSCVLRETEGHRAFHYYALDPVAGKGRLLCSTAWTESLTWNWTVSPDGTEIALPILDPARPRIRIVSCAGPNTEGGTREVSVKIAQPLMEVTWAADSRGWFVSAAAIPKGADLFYVRLDGTATFLRHNDPLWGVPSPDGRKLAFVGETVDSNVWLLN